jgi:hypothetical protein
MIFILQIKSISCSKQVSLRQGYLNLKLGIVMEEYILQILNLIVCKMHLTMMGVHTLVVLKIIS